MSEQVVPMRDASQKQPKKRGRKPKGGEIIMHTPLEDTIQPSEPNIILHLKCKLCDIKNHEFNGSIQNNITNGESVDPHPFNKDDKFGLVKDFEYTNIRHEDPITKENDTVSLNARLKILAQNLHTNNIPDKRSACFWCTCDYDNPSIYIPKYIIDNAYHVYGCFCSPECATGYLFDQSDIDSSVKFERYSHLNHLYCKIYNYDRNIKPAPKPHYILDKFYGTLNIQEYRQLLKCERLLLMVEKPLIRSLPELHIDNDECLLERTGSKLKLKTSKNKQSKSEIIVNNFNI